MPCGSTCPVKSVILTLHIKKARTRLQARYYIKKAAIKALHEQAAKD